jgi:hypothetical protein
LIAKRASAAPGRNRPTAHAIASGMIVPDDDESFDFSLTPDGDVDSGKVSRM